MKARFGLSLAVSMALGCNPNNTGGHDVTPTDTGGGDTFTDNGSATAYPAPYTGLTWTPADVKVASPAAPAGYQGKLLRAPDGTLYYAYFRALGTTINSCAAGQAQSGACCSIAAFSTNDPAPGVNYALDVAVLPAGSSTWTIETLHLERLSAQSSYVTNRYGLEGAIDGLGRPVLVFAGGGPGTFNCGSSDLVMATRSGTGADPWVLTTLETTSAACCAYPVDCPDPDCTRGDVVGPWAAATTNGDGDVVTTYMDYHFNTDFDGGKFRTLALWEPSGVTGIEPWSSRGTYAQLRWLQPKSPSTFSGLIAAYSSVSGIGVFVTRRTGSTGHVADWEKPAGSTTMRDLTSGGTVGERLSLAVAPDGTVGVAFYLMKDGSSPPQTKEDLVYCYSSDNGDHWVVPCQNVDTANTVGQYPSLAYDKKSRPMISYYYCGAGGSCASEGDALRLAWRDDVTGKWLRYVAYADAGTKAGLYTQLVVDPTTDEPTITFQDATRGAAMVVRGHLTGGN
jgi:hypothetical protein